MARSNTLDRALAITVAVLLATVIGFVAYFGYTVYQDRQNAAESSAAARVAKALAAQVKQSPNDTSLRVRYGEALAAANRPQDAIEQFNAALKIDPKHTGAVEDLGLLAMSQKRYPEARSYFNKLIELTNNSEFQDVNQRREVAYYNLGLLAMNDKDFQEAIGQFKSALRIRNDASDTYYYLASALYQAGDKDSALKEARTAVMFDTNYTVAHYLLAQIYMDQKDPINASYEYHKVLTLLPDNPQAQKDVDQFGKPADLMNEAKSMMSTDIEGALEKILIAENLDPQNPLIRVVHAQILVKRGNLKDALAVYKQALKLDPKNAQVQEIVKKMSAKDSK